MGAVRNNWFLTSTTSNALSLANYGLPPSSPVWIAAMEHIMFGFLIRISCKWQYFIYTPYVSRET